MYRQPRRYYRWYPKTLKRSDFRWHLKGGLLPPCFISFGCLLFSSLPSIVGHSKLGYLSFPPTKPLFLWGKERGDLDLHFYQTISLLCEGKPWDLDLGIHLLFPLVFFLSYSPISFVALVEFGSEALEHLCSCHCIGCIGLSSR